MGLIVVGVANISLIFTHIRGDKEPKFRFQLYTVLGILEVLGIWGLILVTGLLVWGF